MQPSNTRHSPWSSRSVRSVAVDCAISAATRRPPSQTPISHNGLTRAGRTVKAYLFDGYWEDIGTIKSFFEANLNLAQNPPNFEFCNPYEGPILTSPRHLPPALIDDCEVEDAIISFGAYVHGSSVTNAIVGLRAVVCARPLRPAPPACVSWTLLSHSSRHR